ncbi:MAG: M48 family metallopeptidase [Myxococcales bacterium]|nr:M48 family metallopeptidase [Myxococcales bacterium]
MDFFAQQAKVRRTSRRLVALFVLAVVSIVVVIDGVAGLLLGLFSQRPDLDYASDVAGVAPVTQWDWQTLLLISAVVLATILVGSLYRVLTLRGGGAAVARAMGATPVPTDTTDPVWRRLRNVIEEIAIASGVPVPDIFVMEREPGINAFAAGYTPADAAVCVTQGCLDKLTRDELQGVIAHEFSHVLNGDMRLNIRLMGLLFGILVLGIIGRVIIEASAQSTSARRSSDRNGGAAALALAGLTLLIVGYVGFFFGRLIQAAVSRSRESLADASAVQFTRQTAGIAGALKKIAALAEGSQLQAHNKQEVAHMLFGEGGGVLRLFATHPPLPERIRDLGETWDEEEVRAIGRAWAAPRRAADPDSPSASLSGFAPPQVSAAVAAAPGESAAMPHPRARRSVKAASVSAHVGQPASEDFGFAGTLHRRVPQRLVVAARQPREATAVVLALALDDDASLRAAQLTHIEALLGGDRAHDAERAIPSLAGLHPMLRLPLAALAFPSLKRGPHAELARLVQTLDALAHADHRVDLHEYCLLTLLRLQLQDVLSPPSGFVPGRRRLQDATESYATLCAIVAAHGHDDDTTARHAWSRAMAEALPGYSGQYTVPRDWQAAFDGALERLDALRPADKARVVRGLTVAVSEDDVVTVAEAELLRVICAALHCPLPPLVGEAIAGGPA